MWKFLTNFWALWLLTLLPLLWLSATLAARRKRRAAIHFSGLFSKSTPRFGVRRTKAFLGYFALFLMLVGMAGPQWGRDEGFETTTGRDLTVVVDMSRSMSAEQPSRFERARRVLLGLCDELEQRGGTRVALVVFAARTKIATPLTLDYDHFRWLLRNFDSNNRPKEIRPKKRFPGPSGTRIGAALRTAVSLQDDRYPTAYNILLVSDGDDPVPDSEWFEGVTMARKSNIRVDVLAVGDSQPRTIPLGNAAFEDQGKPVLSQLNASLLQEIARRTDGEYIELGTQRIDIGTAYAELLRERKQRQGTASNIIVYQQRYRWFLGGALLAWIITMVLPEGKRWPQQKRVTG